MGTRKPLGWILRHKEDGYVLCEDGRRRMKAAGIEEIKMYRYNGWAMRRAGTRFSCHALYEGDHLTCTGEIIEPSGYRR